MSEQIVRANGVDLCAETFGDPSHPAILLVAGAASSMDMWEVDFCERLAAGERFVIRYDLRDTGHSVTYEPGGAPYTFDDLVADAIGLLDFFGIDRAHWVGMSLGTGICQLAVLDHPERVATVTLIASSPGPGAEDLPGIPAEIAAEFRALAEPDWSDRAAVVDHLVEQSRIGAARSVPFDEAEVRAMVELIVGRSANPQSANNHFSVGGVGENGDDIRSRLGQVTTPTLIVHGTEDPVLPLPHGIALAKEIPGAELVTLEATGHELPRRVWDTLIPAILRHTDADTVVRRIAAEALSAGDPTGWFDRVYASGPATNPWDLRNPQRLVTEWAAEHGVTGDGRRAIVVGCGMGRDAEFVAGLGFDTVAFDVSETAVDLARERYPESTVTYVAADLLDPPGDWYEAFDLVVESFTVQALPDPVRAEATVQIGRFVKPGGSLLVVAAARDAADAPEDGPPWPLTRSEIDAFATGGLEAELVEDIREADDPTNRRWRAEFRRPPSV